MSTIISAPPVIKTHQGLVFTALRFTFVVGLIAAYELKTVKLVAKIDAALRRIDEGEYGYCEVTGEPISLKRLDARPIATMSLEAQESHERREKVHRDD